jgi:UDP-glucose 4-epimerase
MIIVIGASGFIGTYVIDDLVNNGFDVLATGRNRQAENYYKKKNIQYVNLDITNSQDFNKLPTDNIEAVILLAGLLPANVKEENVADYFTVNVIGTINVLNFCKNNNIKKLIATSSYADVRNVWQAGKAINENEPRNFIFTGDHAVYVISKNAAGDVIEYYNQEFGMQGIIFRLPPVYGVGPHSIIYVNGKYYKTGIQTFIDNALMGDPIEIWGNPDTVRDIVYVKDVAHAFILAIKSNKAKGLYNMTSGTAVSLEKQVKTIIKLFSQKGKESKIIYRPEKANNTPSFLFDITKAKEDFKYSPQYLPFEKMMVDYKKELESGRFEFLVDSRKKEK